MRKIKYFLIPLFLGIFMYSCEKEDNSVIDPELHFPVITSKYFTPGQFNSDTINILCGAFVQSEDPVEKVEVTFSDLGNGTLVTARLMDDGVYPDSAAGDGKYTGFLSYIFICREVGEHNLKFLATNYSGLTSSPTSDVITVNRVPNLPPLASQIIIRPDSVQVNNPSFFIFMVTAVDPNGQCDIRKVFYTGFRPSGVPLSSSLELFDDGGCCIIPPFNSTSGDTTAGDTKFTRTLFGSTTETGYYRYYIRAVDRSGDTSNVLADSIYVY